MCARFYFGFILLLQCLVFHPLLLCAVDGRLLLLLLGDNIETPDRRTLLSARYAAAAATDDVDDDDEQGNKTSRKGERKNRGADDAVAGALHPQ
uniref:Putative secreted protein n=1 Tax=Anopheles darlingi TaxID=43151 RepID=A0A2M4DLG2_ANODA